MIIGREKEIKKLNELYDSDSAELVAIYGRRRVGKTYLVDENFEGRMERYKMRKKTLVIIIAVVMAVTFIAFPYLKVEYLTARYGSQFEDLYEQTHMIDHADYCKVLECDGSHARCCYVESGVDTNVLEFDLRDGNWEMTKWETIWSSSGSADSFMWPLYR